MTLKLKRIIALGAMLAGLSGCFHDRGNEGWGIQDQFASTPVEFKSWRICKLSAKDAVLRECVQSKFQQSGKSYLFTGHGNPQFPTAARVHVMGKEAIIQTNRYHAYGLLVRNDKYATSGKAYFIFPADCANRDRAKLTAAEKATFEKTFVGCRFKPGISLKVKEHIIRKVALANGGRPYYIMFEPGAKVAVLKDGRLQDGTGSDGLPSDIKTKANVWLTRVSKKWFVNKYDASSVQSVRLVSGNYWSGRSVIRVTYTQNRGKFASADIRLLDGAPQCFNYGDMTGCRPYR